jgi:hypothetical protein
MMFFAIPPAWPLLRKRGVYQVFTLSWDVSFHRPNARLPKPLSIAVARAD